MEEIKKEIDRLRSIGLTGLASILEQHHFGKWHAGVSFEQLMEEDDLAYQKYLKMKQSSIDSSKKT